MTGRIIFVIALLLALPAFAVQPGEQLDDPGLESRAREISSGLRCLVCQNQSIDDSDAPLAADLRVLVRERLKAGDTDTEVVDYVVARYGEFVLLRPRFNRETLLLWASPVLVLGIGVGILLISLRRTGFAPRLSGLSQEEEDLLERIRRADRADHGH